MVVGLHWLTTRARLEKGLDLVSPEEHRSEQLLRLGAALILLATLSSWIYENPVTSPFPHWIRRPDQDSNTFVSSVREGSPTPPKEKKQSGGLIRPNDAAIREGLTHVPHDAHVRTTGNYVPHLSHRIWVETLERVQVSDLSSGVEAIFLNLERSRRGNCDEYFQNLQWALRSGFGVTFYRDDVLLVQKGKGDFRQLKELVENWPGCNQEPYR
jgi:hypothetical protein